MINYPLSCRETLTESPFNLFELWRFHNFQVLCMLLYNKVYLKYRNFSLCCYFLLVILGYFFFFFFLVSSSSSLHDNERAIDETLSKCRIITMLAVIVAPDHFHRLINRLWQGNNHNSISTNMWCLKNRWRNQTI